MRKIYVVFQMLFFVTAMNGQYSLSSTTYSQTFDGLGTASLTNVTGGSLNNVNVSLNGWYFAESGTGANTTITAGTGSSSTGDSYNFGAAANSNRTLGGLQSGSLIPTFGFYFTNNTGSAITALAMTYTGETWRVGATSRSDRIDFQYSTDASLLTNGTWVDIDLLDYANPGQAIGNGSVLHSATVSGSITGLNIANGASFFIRWNDFNASGSDDGMGMNDFNLTALFTLPVNLASVKATHQSTGVSLEWSNLTEMDVINYNVERSADGGNFVSVGTINARVNNGSKVDYSFTDINPFTGANYYRIKSMESSGQIKFSTIVKVDIGKGDVLLLLYPNPVIDRHLTYQANNLRKGQYTLRVFNNAGQQVFVKTLNHPGGSVSEALTLPFLRNGLYRLQLSSGDATFMKIFMVQ